MRLVWRARALEDRDRIARYIAGEGNAQAARDLDADFKAKAEIARQTPEIFKLSQRTKGLREIVVRPHYIMLYRVTKNEVIITNVKHAMRQWPTKGGSKTGK